MNNVFVDVLKEKQALKLNILERASLKFMGFVLKEDKLLKNKALSTYFVLLDLSKIQNNDKYLKMLHRVLKYKKVEKNINVVLSRNISENTKLKESLIKLFGSLDTSYNCVEVENNLKSIDMQYISRYILENKIDVNKFKILLVLDKLKDFDLDKLREYITNYKFVDILKTVSVTKSEYNRLSKVVDKINDEYGSSIEIIQKRNIQNYDYYILYSSNIKEKFKSHYVLNKNAYILDITDVDDDILSKEYKSYEKHRPYLETLFNRLSINLESFKKSELGRLYIKY